MSTLSDRLRALNGSPAGIVPICRDAADELDRLTARVVELEDQLRQIGDFAHDRSTGPAVPDSLWEVREMAYELLRIGETLPEQKPDSRAEEVLRAHGFPELRRTGA